MTDDLLTAAPAAGSESPDDILTLTEAAVELGVTRARVSQWLQQGRAPAVREERIVGVRRRDLATLAAKRRPAGNPHRERKRRKTVAKSPESLDNHLTGK